MTDETSKTRAVRGNNFEAAYLRGRIIDIGCGPDLVVPNAEPFDRQDGDAQWIAGLRPNGAYDAVHSSHCLEHMNDVPTALQQWWALVRPGGYLVLVVPDEDLYEQGCWPSLFNPDHKATFRLAKEVSWSPVSYDIVSLIKNLDDAEIVSCARHDAGYDYSLMKHTISPAGKMLFLAHRRLLGLLRRCFISGDIPKTLTNKLFRLLGAPVDQTTGTALAQIQIVAHKTTPVPANTSIGISNQGAE